ncbi:flagellar basal body-associated protein FliL [Rhodobacterales bacterium HKCCE2091]|nr:flagellar basal body-associated protein FliL [Rhodobacterales bacterium HKCCE2091]
MLRILLPVILLILGLAGGIGAGIMLSGGGEETAAADDGHGETAAGDHGEDAGDGHGETAGDDGHGDDHGAADSGPVSPGSSEDLEYVRLNNQFVVPVVREGTVRSLVVMSLTVEVGSGVSETVFDREPRLRDAFLRVMFSHANAGGFDGSFTSPTSLNPLRSGLRDAARDVLGPSVNDVLIVDIVRQDA